MSDDPICRQGYISWPWRLRSQAPWTGQLPAGRWMWDREPTDRIISKDCVIEAPGTIQPTGPFERALARLLMVPYRRRLRAIVAAAPAWVSEN